MTVDRRLIEDFLPIQATCLRAARRQVSADLPAALRSGARGVENMER
jgi:hypothetical protein